ncbi:FUSC family protein [Geojedonia litorea]|uniref:FUSC family protein n=1 Tax=Geojedonia litorea TaxID=1268269 RepID=A0ABV9MZZ1_9FLAO
MRNLFVVLGFIASILAVILSVTPLFKIAYIPSIAALVFGLIAFYFAKQKQLPKKSIQLVFLLTIIAISLSTYKSVFTVAEVGDTEEMIQKESESEQDALEILEEIELDE